MIGLNHVLTGAAIGLAVQQPLLVAPLAFISHFALDIMPHFGGTPAYEYGHKHFMKIMVTDGVISVGAIITTMLFAPQLAWIIVLGAVFAVLPDFILLHYYTQGRPKLWFHRFHLGIQWFERPLGAFVEAGYLVFISMVVISLVMQR